jgi:hypothetical protein
MVCQWLIPLPCAVAPYDEIMRVLLPRQPHHKVRHEHGQHQPERCVQRIVQHVGALHRAHRSPMYWSSDHTPYAHRPMMTDSTNAFFRLEKFVSCSIASSVYHSILSSFRTALVGRGALLPVLPPPRLRVACLAIRISRIATHVMAVEVMTAIAVR